VRRQLMRPAPSAADKEAPPRRNDQTHMRTCYDYSAVTQGMRRPVPSPSHDARITPPEKARPLRTTRGHYHRPLMARFLLGYG
jgi:hypothetical protein